jgi:hypothetical protein
MRGDGSAEDRGSVDHNPGSASGNDQPTDLPALGAALSSLGCPQHKVNEMAAQLDKRARQLAGQKQRSYEDALAHLLGLMRQGWAAQERGGGR